MLGALFLLFVLMFYRPSSAAVAIVFQATGIVLIIFRSVLWKGSELFVWDLARVVTRPNTKQIESRECT